MLFGIQRKEKARKLRAFKINGIKSIYLLPSRLYCRFRSFTGSARRLADFTAGGELHPALKIRFSIKKRKRFVKRKNCVRNGTS